MIIFSPSLEHHGAPPRQPPLILPTTSVDEDINRFQRLPKLVLTLSH